MTEQQEQKEKTWREKGKETDGNRNQQPFCKNVLQRPAQQRLG